jgi:hypothetical protein
VTNIKRLSATDQQILLCALRVERLMEERRPTIAAAVKELEYRAQPVIDEVARLRREIELTKQASALGWTIAASLYRRSLPESLACIHSDQQTLERSHSWATMRTVCLLRLLLVAARSPILGRPRNPLPSSHPQADPQAPTGDCQTESPATRI